MRSKTSGSIHDWASEAAEYIYHLSPRPTEERIAAIIATFAEPLITLLNESRRAHRHDGLYGKTCCPQCTCHSDDDEEREPNGKGPCNCEAGAWNAKVDSVLGGRTNQTRTRR
jgi:hypothetical protein